MKKNLSALMIFVALSSSASLAQSPVLLIRCDDIGMCHSVNMAARQLIDSGLPFSASVMFVCPWHQEAVDLLRDQPQIAVGVHLTLNAEWKNFRWGPVIGWKSAQSLTDSCGYFFPSRARFFAHKPRMKEIEKELRAQIDRAMATGLRIDYLDYHMSTAVSTEPLRQLVEKLAHEYGLGISRYYGEQDTANMYDDPPAAKADSLVQIVAGLTNEHMNLLVCHIGVDTAELAAMVDLNPHGLPYMSVNRQGELNALLAVPFRQMLQEKHIKLETYRTLKEKLGTGAMKRPAQL